GQPGAYVPPGGAILPAGPQTNVPIAAYSMSNLDATRNPTAGSSTYSVFTKYNLADKYLVPGETTPTTSNPTGNTNPNYYGFNLFDPNTYANGDQFERTNIWMIYNFFNPGTSDMPFGWSEMEAMLRYGGTGSPAMSSLLFQLSPQSFAVARARRLVTTH